MKMKCLLLVIRYYVIYMLTKSFGLTPLVFPLSGDNDMYEYLAGYHDREIYNTLAIL